MSQSGRRRGFLLSLDAVIAIGLMLTLVMFMGGLSLTYYSPELRYQRLYYMGKDLLMLLESAKIEQLQDFDVIQYYMDEGVLTQDDLDKSLLDIIGSLWATENATLQDYAANITNQVLNSTISPNYNYAVILGGDNIYQRGPSESTFLARLSTIVSGIERGKPVEGFFARAYPGVVGGVYSEYFYFGGYVGEGNISALIELPYYDTILDMDMELDIGMDFDFYINGQFSGSYQRYLNDTMRSNSWDIDPSYYGFLHNGINNISIEFPEQNSFIGGGYVRIVYNTSNLTAGDGNEYGDNATKTYLFPGIDGIMNLYSSIYVPGTLKDIMAYLHYDSAFPVTKYLTIGSVEVFESNETGEQYITISNQSIAGNLSGSGYDFTYLSGKTVPVRAGLKNISFIFGEAGMADVALITDRTGSMESNCDVETDCVAGLCDSWDPCHDRRSHIAVESDREFVNRILGAEGINRIGLIGYGERHGKTCSFHEVSNNNASLQARISDYDYGDNWEDCGYTCTSCGVVGATELLQENEILYNLTVLEDIDRNMYDLDSGTASRTVTLSISGLNKSRFVKSSLNLLSRGEDVDNGYQQCVFLNSHYLGRTCTSSEGSSDFHICSYVVEKDWISEGVNTIQLTNGNQNDCWSAGSQDWSFKDVKLSIWEYKTNTSLTATNSSSQELMMNMITHYAFADIPEIEADYPNPVDFTSGLNTSGNTFGLGSAEDEWDWESGTYGYAGTCTFNPVVGEIEMYAQGSDESCAYGAEVEITPEIYSLIQSGGRIAVSFKYEWDGNDNPFEGSDQVWIKSRWSSPPGTTCEDPDNCYLGSHLDSNHDNGDGTVEVAAADNPDDDFTGFFYQDITPWVEGTGTYYLDFGGKLNRNRDNEWGYFRFDNISVSIYNSTDNNVYPSFPGIDMDLVKAATLTFEARYIDPDKFDCVYVNGYHMGMIDYQEINGSDDWETARYDILPIYLKDGDNEIKFSGGTDRGCNRTGDNDQWMARNVQLSIVYSDETHEYDRRKSMVIMSDGDANTVMGDCRNYGYWNCPEVPGWLTPYEETVVKACEAHEKYNITIYTVAFGNAGQDAIDMLQEAACCDNCSNFYTSNDADELQEIYSRIASGILNASYVAQRIEVSKEIGSVTSLFPDSYITINYSSSVGPSAYGEFTYNFQGPRFENMSGNETITDPYNYTKHGWFVVPSNVEVVEARITSYSSQYWTDRLYVKNESSNWSRVYWLQDFGEDNYTTLGDPFIVDIPVEYIASGENNSVRIGTGFWPYNGTGGSPDSRVIYAGRIGGITMEGYSDVFPKAEGSTVTVYYDIDGDNISDGSSNIQLGTNPSDVFDPMNDSVDNAFMRLLDLLNVIWDANPGGIGNGSVWNPYDGGILNPANPIDFQLTSNIQFDSVYASGVPSMWGPTELEVWIWN